MSDRENGRTENLIKSIPDDLSHKIYLVAGTYETARTIKEMIPRIKGKKFPLHLVEPREISDISQWGKGVWSNRFYFDHTCFDSYKFISDLDKHFLECMYYTERTRYIEPTKRNKNLYKRILGFFNALFKTKK